VAEHTAAPADGVETLHYLAESLLPLCDHVRIMRGEPIEPPSAPCTSTTVAAEVTCRDCREWLHG
jgi:hypothetical protein